MVRIVGYARVSTPDQSLRRQVVSILEYANARLEVSTGKQAIQQIAEYIADADPAVSPVETGDVVLYFDQSLGRASLAMATRTCSTTSRRVARTQR